jgi:C1A family cysteine protease
LALNSLKSALTAGHPSVVGIRIFASFEGHTVVIVGYLDVKQAFLVRNSWGTNWGIKGHFTLPYAYLTDVTLASDAWVILSAS